MLDGARPGNIVEPFIVALAGKVEGVIVWGFFSYWTSLL